MPFISRKKHAQLLARVNKAESDLASIKGFYEGDNSQNDYLKRIAAQLNGIKLPSMASLNRDEIRRAYENIAPVNGVIDYIARRSPPRISR